MSAIMLRGGHIYSPVDPFATALLMIDGVIRWIGSDTGADTHRDTVDDVWELQGALVTPGFVDAHVHATATGLLSTGLDLSTCRSADDLLALLSRAVPADGVVWGHGWDETTWSDNRLPSREAIDAVAGSHVVYLSRIDVHSALVSSALVDQMSGSTDVGQEPTNGPVVSWPGFDPVGPLTRSAHAIARSVAFASITDAQREVAQRWTLSQAARCGIVSMHEMAGPSISSSQDLRALNDLATSASGVEVVAYWGELNGIETAQSLGARGCAGDLFVDGSLGSHTAALRAPYSDAAGETGTLYLTAEQIAEHIVLCTQAGLQAGFHVIGDAALDTVMAGFVEAEKRCGITELRQCRHRLEHAEMLDAHQINAMATWGVAASMQPAFDAAWGGEHQMYAQRLGATRAMSLNPFAALSQAGVCVAFGSDAPVTALDPWGSVRAAAFHHNAEQRVSVRAAFAAHTRGGRRSAHQEHLQPGVLREDAPATIEIWESTDLVVQAPDTRIAAWSTDDRSGTPGLPDLSLDRDLPECLVTMRDGAVIHATGAIQVST